MRFRFDWYLIKRWIRHKYQKSTRGFSNRDLWNLDKTIAIFILPRLKAFVESSVFIDNEPGRRNDYNKIIYAFERIVHEFDLEGEYANLPFPGCDPKIREGLRLFSKHYFGMWY